MRRIVILPFPLFLYPRVISQASREHHFTTGDLSRTDRRCGLRDFAQTLAVAVDHGNHDSPRPSTRCRFSRRCRRCPLRRWRYLRNLIPLHCPLPPFGPSPENSHHTRRDRIDPASLHCLPLLGRQRFRFVRAIGIDPLYCPHRSGERFRRLFPVLRKNDRMIEFPPVNRPHPDKPVVSCERSRIF